MLTHKQLRTKALGNAGVKVEYDKLGDEFALLDEFLKARASQGLTQAQVAEKIGTTQSAVARMEQAAENTHLFGQPCPDMPKLWVASLRFGWFKMRDQLEI